MDEKKITITVKQINRITTILGNRGDSLYTILCDNDLFVDAVCAGRGTCGQCGIQLIEGDLPVSTQDEEVFSKQELRDGYRLSCQAYPEDDCVIYLREKETYQTDYDKKNQNIINRNQDELGIAIDIGTTTIIYKVISKTSKEELVYESQLNENRMYGADVLSRIEAANNGLLPQICRQMRSQLKEELIKLTYSINVEHLTHIIISANMTMIHFLMNYSCEKLGKYPFTPYTTEWIKTDAKELEILEHSIPVTILPAISAFVGGDIVSGLYSLGILSSEKKVLFLDLGTNGEMALSDGKGHLFVTSASAGPAFEGGNISCGIGSVNGAIQGVTFMGLEVKLDIIGNGTPVGICGSGIIESLYELRKHNIIDETGLLIDAYFDNGYPISKEQELVITQKDIREIQMAKAAIAAGIDMLLKEAGYRPDEIEDIYLAGGFGYHLSIEKAVGIGLLKKEWMGRIHLVGNTSLMGAYKLLCSQNYVDEIAKIKAAAHEIYLSNIPEFEEHYLQNMTLEDIDEKN